MADYPKTAEDWTALWAPGIGHLVKHRAGATVTDARLMAHDDYASGAGRVVKLIVTHKLSENKSTMVDQIHRALLVRENETSKGLKIERRLLNARAHLARGNKSKPRMLPRRS